MSSQQLAYKAGCSADEVESSITELKAAGLIELDAQGTIHSPMMNKIYTSLRNRAKATAKHRAGRVNAAAEGSAADRVSRDPGCDTPCDPGCDPDPPSLPRFPSHTLPSLPTQPPLSFSSKTSDGSGDAAKPPRPAEVKPEDESPKTTKKTRSKPDRQWTPEQTEIRKAFIAWWVGEAYPGRHPGTVYAFNGGRDQNAVTKLLDHTYVKWDLAKAQKVAKAFLHTRDDFEVRQGLTLGRLGDKLQRWIDETAAGRSGQDNSTRSPNGNHNGHTNGSVSTAKGRQYVQQVVIKPFERGGRA